jgi:hypothetical protein
MRVLDFDVNRQIITKSPECDFNDIVAGTQGYLKARFNFSREWAGYMRVAVFTCRGAEEARPLLGNMCDVPSEVLLGDSFKVTVVGKRGNDKLTCNAATVIQRRC